ncbi:MAG TPA: hypothetical protein DEA62_03435 [Coxiellaceae bacterium]|nr:hypothetical protein [Coxiellaceae bacterium]HBY55625.1 hypothetical protein [Coxiellaceae bacterium]
MPNQMQEVKDFWNKASCGEDLYLKNLDRNGYEAHSKKRYELEPYILEFVNFNDVKGKRILEIGIGLGAEHQLFAQGGADLYGIDLTERAVEHTRRRLSMFGLYSQLGVGDSENLTFGNESFDLVYSWGVLHHSPDTAKAVAEVHRVLKSGGIAKIMIYHKWSLVGLMLWFRYALLRLRPWLSLSEIYASYLESPGTKAYSVVEAKQLFSDFSDVKINIVLCSGDLLISDVGQRHRSVLLAVVKKIWPRAFLKRYFSKFGLFMLIEARKF